eukprot:10702648-Ditylum_brightwellii.AAC.1
MRLAHHFHCTKLVKRKLTSTSSPYLALSLTLHFLHLDGPLQEGTALPGLDKTPHVNVNTMTLAGLDCAKEQNLIASNLANVIITPYIYEANAIFPADHKGRLFATFCNPIDRT